MLRVALCLLFAASLPAEKVEVRGTYSHPKPFWDRGARLDDYAINAVFVHSGSIKPDLLARAASEGARVYAEFATLNGKGYVEKHPEAWPINERGERAPAATWFLGACPTEPGFRAFRLKQLADLLDAHPVSGVWMDYFHWHAQFEDPNPVLPETCFNPTCLEAFQKAAGIRLPDGAAAEKARFILQRHERAWRDWRVSVLVEWAREFRSLLKAKRPQALLGLYHCPWTEDEYGGALRRALGLDLKRLEGIVDVYSPMVYHGRMGRSPAWVGSYVQWLSRHLGLQTRIWPIVQAHNDPGVISAAEFEQVLRGGVSGRASGVMMFTIRSVAEDAQKMETLRRLYRQWAAEAEQPR